MRDLGLPDRIAAKGVQVVKVAGYETRGNDGGAYRSFDPIGALLHHTAGSTLGVAPSLNTCIYGRPDVPGPLAQAVQGRHPTVPLLDPVYVIATGKANHGGTGTWTGQSGTFNDNYECEGLEVEHPGTGPVDPDRLEVSARVIAAMLEAPGSSRDASMAAQHAEYARPLGRKIDFYDLAPTDAPGFRRMVGFWIGRTIAAPIKPKEMDDMFILEVLDEPGHDPILIGGGPPRRLTNDERTAYRNMRDDAADGRRVVPKIKVTKAQIMLIVRSEAARFGVAWS
jgi:hypothetical protein